MIDKRIFADTGEYGYKILRRRQNGLIRIRMLILGITKFLQFLPTCCREFFMNLIKNLHSLNFYLIIFK
ncbi:unnamed protein product [Meloidogyne enterolobii]|uniref:Uncharacterized protein n=1 Tax=Meloidogyne enterolobii TaxID=390850 RepID=A0ACB0Z2I7_MELEN